MPLLKAQAPRPPYRMKGIPEKGGFTFIFIVALLTIFVLWGYSSL